jgi:hypothetical protein
MQVDHEAAVAVLKEQLAAAEKCAEDVAADMQDKLKAAQVRPFSTDKCISSANQCIV